MREQVVSALMSILAERWVLTLALADAQAGLPYSTPLFYALARPDTVGRHAAPLLISASAPDSHHGRLAGLGPTPASAAVYLESEAVAELRGAQLRGEWLREQRWTAAGAAALRRVYLERHPVAEPLLASGQHALYALRVTWAKLTDNRVRLGHHALARFDAECSEVKPSPT